MIDTIVRFKRWLSAAALVTLGVFAGGVVIASGSSGEPATTTTGLPGGLPVARAQATTISADAASTYPLLGRPVGQSDSLTATGVDPGSVATFGANPRLARRALTTPRGESLYVVPANRAVCLASSDGIVNSCGPVPRATSNQMIGGVAVCAPGLPRAEIEVAGLLPSDATDVTLGFDDGTFKPLELTNGAFAVNVLKSDPLPTSVGWRGSAGAVKADTGVPEDAASDGCDVAAGKAATG